VLSRKRLSHSPPQRSCDRISGPAGIALISSRARLASFAGMFSSTVAGVDFIGAIAPAAAVQRAAFRRSATLAATRGARALRGRGKNAPKASPPGSCRAGRSRRWWNCVVHPLGTGFASVRIARLLLHQAARMFCRHDNDVIWPSPPHLPRKQRFKLFSQAIRLKPSVYSTREAAIATRSSPFVVLLGA